MEKLPKVSIIIPTLNRKNDLRRALFSLKKVDYPRDRLEIVVVSDGSTDGTDKMIGELKKRLNYRLVFLKEKHAGISNAKNVAIKKAKGEIIVSTDDDCLFEKGWLKKLIKPLSDLKIGSVGGPDRAVSKEGWLAKSIDFAFSSFVGSGGIHGRFIKGGLGKFYPVGCNMAFPKKVVKEIGYFDVSLAPGEETDFNHRLERAGYQLDYVPEAFVWHRPKSEVASFIPYILKRGAARVEILRRHREFAELIYFLPALMVVASLVLLILSFFSALFFKILVLFGLFYGFFLLTAGFSALFHYRQGYVLLTVPPLIFLQHFCHGIGFLTATVKLFSKKLLVFKKCTF